MADAPTLKPANKAKKTVSLIIKILITVLCFWYISKKIDFTAALQALFSANWLFLAIAVFLLLFSKLQSAWRLQIYFRNIGLWLPQWQNIKLYWLGMFYNLFLPGAISGDAYKVILLNRRYAAPYKTTSAAVLLDRFSGLLALGLILAAYGLVVLPQKEWASLLIAGAVLGVAAFYFVVKRFFKGFLPGFWPTFFWGLGVQLTQVVCVYFILQSIQLPLLPEWIFIFLITSVVSVFPVSLGGGLGTRELVFAEGARYFGLDPQLGVTVSLLFYLSNVICSAGGAYFVYHDPLKEKAQKGF